MQLVVGVALLVLAAPVLPFKTKYSVSYDPVYDQGHHSLKRVACSNGEHGLITSGHTTFDSLPTFPFIGGAPQITSWNSRYCGSCWKLTHTDRNGHSNSINITAIDTGDKAEEGFNISLEGMDALTEGHAVHAGRVEITAVKLPRSSCGL